MMIKGCDKKVSKKNNCKQLTNNHLIQLILQKSTKNTCQKESPIFYLKLYLIQIKLTVSNENDLAI